MRRNSRSPQPWSILVMATAAMLAGSPARAQQAGAPARQAMQQACATDYQTLCAGVRPGGGRILACFRQHSDRLSPGCRDALAASRTARQAPATSR